MITWEITGYSGIGDLILTIIQIVFALIIGIVIGKRWYSKDKQGARK